MAIPETKPLYASVTLYGAALTLIGTGLNAAGIDASDQITKLQDMLPTIVQIIGIIVVIYGRLRKGGSAPVTQAQAVAQHVAVTGLQPMGGK